MDIRQAIIMFEALSQETRLRVFRLLVRAGTDGLAAGMSLVTVDGAVAFSDVGPAWSKKLEALAGEVLLQEQPLLIGPVSQTSIL